MRHRAIAFLAVLPLLAACQISPAARGTSPYAPAGAPRDGEAVDGLTVGHRLMEAGEYSLALEAYYRAAAERGTSVDVLSAIGSADLRLGRLGQAEQMLRRAIDADERFVPAWNNLGVVLMEKGEVPEASRVFRTAYALDSGSSDEIRENLRLALAQMQAARYDPPKEPADYKLVRRGYGEYLLLGAN
ncbi:tetratricopeptide repeat protein [Frigidibacter sp. MR17.24]|uniref:tetratricopeptide repeat protein n=1 Tax=Frigidibacter sp. MR17.24 TaxID=3127345 RepID=UPI003012A9BD